MGEGLSGTTIKKTWIKPRGGVESEEGGGGGVVIGKDRWLYLNNKTLKKWK